jgi:diacylglycerol O-acyltransferase / wax synthase
VARRGSSLRAAVPPLGTAAPRTRAGAAMSAVDTVWLHMEDPTNLMMVTGLIMLAGPLDFARFKALLAARLLSFERFRQRVVESVVPLRAPRWEPDAGFDLDAHVHRLALVSPRSQRCLLDTVDDLASTPLDFTKPPWQVHVIERFRGRSVVVMRVHHCIADGTAMIAVVSRLFDPRARTPPELPLPPAVPPAPGVLAPVTQLVRAVVHEALAEWAHPGHFAALAQRAWQGAETVGHALLMPADPLTPFKGALGVRKHVAWSTPVSLAVVKRIGKRFDAKVNDVLIAAMTGALRYCLLRLRHPLRDARMRAVVPVDLRAPGHAQELGNHFGLVFLDLPVAISDPRTRLQEVKRAMDAIKRSPEPYVYFGLLNVFGRTPKQVEEQILRLFGSKASAVMTNVAGPRRRLYLAGTAIDNLMFWVPQSGRLGLGISILSYAGKVTLGVITDAGLVADPGLITRRFATEFEQLRRAR